MTDQEKFAKLAELYGAKAQGKTLQGIGAKREWFDTEYLPSFDDDLNRWRVKPELRSFDTTVPNSDFSVHIFCPDESWLGKRVRVTEILEDE